MLKIIYTNKPLGKIRKWILRKMGCNVKEYDKILVKVDDYNGN